VVGNDKRKLTVTGSLYLSNKSDLASSIVDPVTLIEYKLWKKSAWVSRVDAGILPSRVIVQVIAPTLKP
jgi:hypothetical protein